MAAYRGGVKTVFIPKENIPDLDEVDETVRANVEFIPVSYVSDIIDAALISHDEETVQRFSAPAAKEPIRAGIS